MINIWLVRHGQSQSQISATDDELNPDLSDLGIRQARRLVKPLAEHAYDRIRLSPLRRAWKTWQLSQATAPDVAFDSRLIESYGPERYSSILPVETPDTARADTQDAWSWEPDRRARSFVEDLLADSGGNVLIFGHWNSISMIYRAFIGADPKDRSPVAITDNAAINLLQVNRAGTRFIQYWNARDHVHDIRW